MSEKDCEYRKLAEFRAGDFIHRWGDNLEVLSVDPLLNGRKRLVYKETDGKEKFFTDADEAEYLALKRPESETPATPRQQFQAATRLNEQGLHIELHNLEGEPDNA